MDDKDAIVTAIHEASEHLMEGTPNWLACGYCVLLKNSKLWMYTFFMIYLCKQIVKFQKSLTIDIHFYIMLVFGK